ncbi:hypothetical protein [Methylomagnum ishizawai]|uniref:hypothetical protein n=1 Tax=Methylomagnum ishizawai TaxID=1760988 RepID=UPI000F74B89E|nr:hypothetical protein [Methylomagnum ishizawai]
MARKSTTPGPEAGGIVHIDHGQPWTASMIVAAGSGRRHGKALRPLDDLAKKGPPNPPGTGGIGYRDGRASPIAMPRIGGGGAP